MSINLQPKTERRIQDKMTLGRYRSPDDVVHEGLRLLEERDREVQQAMSGVREKIAAGLAELDRGDTVDGEAAFEQLLAELDGDEAK